MFFCIEGLIDRTSSAEFREISSLSMNWRSFISPTKTWMLWSDGNSGVASRHSLVFSN